MHHTTPSAYLDICQLWELDQRQERDAIPQVIFNKKELQPIAVCALSELYTGEQECHSAVVSTTQSARDNDSAQHSLF